MESISDFWKSARERVSNPIAFAYIVAWFTFNWKVTAAIFLSETYPGDQTIFEFLESQLRVYPSGCLFVPSVGCLPYFVGLSTYICPLIIAIIYVTSIAFFRQAVGWMNIKLDNFGNKQMIQASKGGKVSVEKFLVMRDELLEKRKRLEDLFAQESDKDLTIRNQSNQINSLQATNISYQKEITTFQTTNAQIRAKIDEQLKQIETASPAVAELPVVKKRLEEMQDTYSQLLTTHETLRMAMTVNNQASDERQRKLNDAMSMIADLNLKLNDYSSIEAMNKSLGMELSKTQKVVIKLREYKIIDGTWEVSKTEEKGTNQYLVLIENGLYQTVEGDFDIKGFFYDDRDRQMSFYYSKGPTTPNTEFNVYTLRMENSNLIVGIENGYPISFKRVQKLFVADALQKFASDRDKRGDENFWKILDTVKRVQNLGNPNKKQ